MSYVIQYPNSVTTQKLTVLSSDRLFGRISRFRGLAPFEDPDLQDRIALAERAAQTAPQSIVPVLESNVAATIVILSFAGTLLKIWPPLVALILLTVVPMARTRARQNKRVRQLTVALTPKERRNQTFARYGTSDRRAAKELRFFDSAEALHRRMIASMADKASRSLRMQRQQTLNQVIFGLVGAAVTTIGLVVAVRGVESGRLKVGDIAFVLAAMTGVQGAFSSIVTQFGQLGNAISLFRYYVDIVDMPEDLPDGGAMPPPLRSAIEFDDVWFRYRDDGPWVVRGANFRIPVGTMTGLVGENGAGKSSLVKLLCRFYDPQRGRITWDGRDLRDFDLHALRRRMTASFQDYGEYDLTVAENIAIGALNDDTEAERVRAAAKFAGVDDAVCRLPAGYETLLSLTLREEPESTAECATGMLSVGQWQRIALARAFIREDADLLVLDEPTASLDALGEERVCTAIRQNSRYETVLMISHRPSTLRHCDRIVVMVDGRVVESGSQEDLRQRNGAYTRLFADSSSDAADPGRRSVLPDHAVRLDLLGGLEHDEATSAPAARGNVPLQSRSGARRGATSRQVVYDAERVILA